MRHAKLKILDLPLIGILAALGTAAAAQEIAPAAPAPAPAPVGRSALQLPGGAVVWATEDPNLGQPELAISGPSIVGFDAGRIVQPVRFFLRSNYSAFVERYELVVYRGHDSDLVQPVARVAMPVAAVAQGEWDGALPADMQFRTGDELLYVLRAYDAKGNFDETAPRKLQLVTPAEAERGTSLLRQDIERSLGRSLTAEQATGQALVEDAFAGSSLRQQNIPIYGSRVRINGRNIPEGRSIVINGENYPVDREGKLAAEYLMPVGHHSFAIELTGGEDAEPVSRTLDVEVRGSYLFAVGIADVTLYQNDADGAGSTLALEGRDDDILSDGRLAFYLKAKARGKYLITAHADTKDQPLEDLFDGFTKAEPQDVFRRLDPDLYYPTYGDDSVSYRDVDTMGRIYVRVDWDKNQALWGNFYTGITGTEYAQYVRSLYGAAVSLRSRGANAWGDPKSELKAFGSEAQTAPGHSEFIGTGGSLYYLRHTDVLPGSDRVVLEVRDRTTGRVEQRIEMVRGADYEIDELQGRIILTRPLAQVTRENIPTITRDAPLDGFEQRLLVDYEWVPTGFSDDSLSAGVRGKHWFGDHLGVGVTYVDENRSGEDYSLLGADVTLQAGRGTYLKVEHSRTEATSAPVFFSDNGGLSFVRLNPGGPREGEATAVETRANFQELGLTGLEWTAAAWWRDVDAGYSVSRYDTGEDVTEYGAELLGQVTGDLRVHARYSKAERGADSLVQAQANAELRFGESNRLAAEVRRVEESYAGGEAAGLLGAMRYTHRFGTALDLYGTAQLTLDDDGGRYVDNDAFTLGTRYNFGDLSSVGAEATTGDRGDAVQFNGEYRISPTHSVYGTYSFSTDRTAYDPLFNPGARNGWTMGQRVRLSNQVHMFNESQFLKEHGQSGLARTFGMDFYPAAGWTLGVTFSEGDLVNSAGGQVDRRAISVNGGRTSVDLDWHSKLEWRKDSGAEQVTQWVTTNRLSYRVSESWRIAGRLNYSDTDDDLVPGAGARFVEGNVGFAFRPWNSTRWGLFGRYTYLYDLASSGQVGSASDYDQKTQLFSLEGVYRHDRNWELAAKLARREGEARFGRGTGLWFDSGATFAAGQIRYELHDRWHALAEYRWLDVEDGGTRHGALIGIDRDITENLRIGAGYNFTKFSDDLTDFDFDHRGWFINFVGSY